MSDVPEILPYASPRAKQRVSPVARLRTLGFALGIATLVVSGIGIVVAVHEFSEIRIESSYRPESYSNEFETRHDVAVAMIVILSAFVFTSLLLILAARAIRRSPPGGFILLWLYAILQFFAGIALGVTFMEAIYHSPGDMLFFIGAIPGLLACAYPAFLLIYLPFVAERFMTDGVGKSG
jgi:hypothetical protein